MLGKGDQARYKETQNDQHVVLANIPAIKTGIIIKDTMQRIGQWYSTLEISVQSKIISYFSCS